MWMLIGAGEQLVGYCGDEWGEVEVLGEVPGDALVHILGEEICSLDALQRHSEHSGSLDKRHLSGIWSSGNRLCLWGMCALTNGGPCGGILLVGYLFWKNIINFFLKGLNKYFKN